MKRQLAAIMEAIARAEKRLASLDAERAELALQIDKLRHELSSLEAPTPPATESPELSPPEKILLFRSLFKGREDVYPKMWVSRNGERKGYMPACGNDGSKHPPAQPGAFKTVNRSKRVFKRLSDHHQWWSPTD